MTEQNNPDLQEILDAGKPEAQTTEQAPETPQEPEAQGKPEEVVTPDEKAGEEGKSNFVKTEDPAVQARINDLWKQSRISDSKNDLLRKEIVKAYDVINKITDRFQTEDNQKALGLIKDQLKEAQEMGDTQRVVDLVEKLTDAKAEIRATKQTPQTQQQAQPQAFQFSEADGAFVRAKATEKNADGSPRRAWLADESKVDEVSKKASDIFTAAWNQGKQLRIDDVIDELDRVYKPVSKSPEVLTGANLNVSQRKDTLNLSDSDKATWRKLGFKEDEISKMSKAVRKGDSLSMDNWNGRKTS